MPTLNWIGKSAVEKHHKDVPYRLLELVPELSCGDSDSGNLIVQGDNLHALKALLPRYAGKVKCIYIDPPYNTGNEGWVYNDNVNSPEIRKWLGAVVGKEGETLDRHDRWLCMMYPRLVLLREFLRDDGSIWISIDDNEQAHLKLLIDEIFGGGNFLANIVWQKRTSPDARINLGAAHDYITVYAKNLFNTKTGLNKVRLSDGRTKDFKNPDNDSRGVWASVDLTGQTGHATSEQFYEIVTPNGKVIKPPANRCWALAEKTFNELRKDGRIWFGKDGNARPRQKKFLIESEGANTWTWWTNAEAGHNQDAKKEVKIFDEESVFDTPKPERLIQRIFQIATNENDLVLDSFLGSGTTTAVAHKMNRRYIGIEMGEHAETHCQTRLQKVVEGEQGGISKAVNWTGGGGFQFCRLSKEPLFTADGQVRDDVTFTQLAEFVWFKETGTGYTGNAESPLLGVFEDRAVYLLYNGILGDKASNGGNVLTPAIFKRLPAFDGPKVIYATAREKGDAWLKKQQILFKQTPYELNI
ncbi:DNA methylase [Crenothrix polyspora]|uniref:site-specific DNA-methyltransferase (adenine-specific) n=1 Tax=Crenothrix polyspora TaxID=360316 RepID=A0A1R4HBG7_9GAMM|nr:site-specific DNA-methyltransferase [Crenothrix polyspora]SJM93559.1 DNA methylase [Crenothrix polyspora]